MARNAKLTGAIAAVALVAASCAAGDDVISSEGPIPNPAIEAGQTQAQGAPGPDGPTFEQEDLSIEIDGESVVIENIGDFEQLDEIALQEFGSIADCQAILSAAPSQSIDRCSYNPTATEVIVDQLAVGQCENGLTYLTLNRPDGSGAFVGLVGESWIELTEDVLSLQTVELICQGISG